MAEETKTCRYCGKQIPADAKQCSYCGKSTGNVKIIKRKKENNKQTETEINNEINENNENNEKSKNKSTNGIIFAILLIIMIICVSFAFASFWKEHKQKQEQERLAKFEKQKRETYTLSGELGDITLRYNENPEIMKVVWVSPFTVEDWQIEYANTYGISCAPDITLSNRTYSPVKTVFQKGEQITTEYIAKKVSLWDFVIYKSDLQSGYKFTLHYNKVCSPHAGDREEVRNQFDSAMKRY
ncbi:MAG: zinc ribbon domain-containing protein [Candidatus Gastranaerophilales bacterium]|nr:zinc ribbon domain-containing protein [Candidatus Gastranaerophilales bacterium]